MPSRGPANELHRICYRGTEEAMLHPGMGLVSKLGIDINQGDRAGFTALMLSSRNGSSHGVGYLLDNGADCAIVAEDGLTALQFAAERGHLTVCNMLIDAGADLEAADCQGSTPLHKASFGKHAKVVRALIEAGANVDSRDWDGGTPLYCASMDGDIDVTRELLLANANAQLGSDIIPIDMAAGCGHSHMVRELLQQRGIEGCGGVSGGVNALHAAAQHNHVDILAMLTKAGVVDTGTALIGAAERGHDAPVKLLLQEHSEKNAPGVGAYVNNKIDDPFGRNPLRRSVVEACRACAPRVVRMLVDAGVDTASAVPITKTRGGYGPATNATLLAFTTRNLRKRTAGGKPATEEELHRLEAVRRLLLRVKAVRAVSWLWPNDAPLIGRVGKGDRKAKKASAPLGRMLPSLRRRAATRGAPLAPLFRYAQKP